MAGPRPSAALQEKRRALLQVRLRRKQEEVLARRRGTPAPGEERSLRPRSTVSPLVPLGSEGTRPPLFLVHAVGGSVVPFIGLSALLGDDRPVYALEDPGLQGGAVEPRELAGIAADYLAVVREVEPEGPLHLGGWSAGGLVALEMARQDGDAATVLLLDTRLPDASPDPDDDQLRSWFTADIAGMGVDLGESELAERLPVFAENVRAFLRHRPSPVSTRVVLLRAQESASAYLSRRYADADAVHPVPGNHYTMLQPPHVEPLAQVVRERLSEVRVR